MLLLNVLVTLCLSAFMLKALYRLFFLQGIVIKINWCLLLRDHLIKLLHLIYAEWSPVLFYEDRLKWFVYALHGLFWEEGGFFISLDVLSELMLRWDIRFSHCGLLISETGDRFFWIRWSTALASCWAALFFLEFPALCSLLFEVWSEMKYFSSLARKH